jgi:gliding motility-associated-like protein
MILKPFCITFMSVLCCLQFVYPQCSTPVVSISGTYCTGSQLQFNSNIIPSSVTWSLGGNVLATQTGTFTTQGTTIAGGNGLGANANQLNYPDRLYVAGDGTIYIPDMENDRVQKWLPGATSGITVAGGNGKGAGPNQLNKPTSVFLDQQGNIYVTDQNNNRVQKWAPGATQGVTVAGDGRYGILNYPTDVFIDANGNIYVSDQGNSVVRKYPPGGAVIGQVIAGVASNSGSGANQLYSPTAIYIDPAGNLYICDTDNMRVQKWVPGATAGVTIASGYNPIDICGDCNGNIYVADYGGQRIMKYDAQGNATLFAGGNGTGSGPNQFNNPAGVALFGNNEMFIADFRNHRIQKYTSSINPVFTPSTLGTYTVTANYNCCPAYVKTFELKNGVADVSITATNANICPGELVTFSSQNTSQVTTPVYQWNLNGIQVGTNTDQFSTTTLQGSDKVYCNISGTDVCGSNATGASNTLQIKIQDTLLPDLGPDLIICPGADILLKTTTPFAAYVWQNNSMLAELRVNAPGKYYVTIQDQCSRAFADTLSVSLFETDNSILPADTTICYYETPTIKPVKVLAAYYWSDQTTANATTIAHPGLYWLQATDDNGCTVRDSINFYAKNCPARGIYMPNAFTPDNNGRNDLLKPVIYGTIVKYRFSVFNRYGQMVFNTTDPARGWNGTINNNYPNAGTYVWYCTFELEGKNPVTEKGTVLLLK